MLYIIRVISYLAKLQWTIVSFHREKKKAQTNILKKYSQPNNNDNKNNVDILMIDAGSCNVKR